MSRKECFKVFAAVVILIVFAVATHNSYSSCDKKGGDLVRGMIWFECVNVPSTKITGTTIEILEMTDKSMTIDRDGVITVIGEE